MFRDQRITPDQQIAFSRRFGSMLHAQALPSDGGDTLSANMHLARDTLP